MRNMLLGAAIAAILVSVGYVAAQPQSQYGLADIKQPLRDQSMRPCIFPAGGWTIVDCSAAAAATSAQLNAWSRYIVQCTDDSYIATGDSAAMSDADSSDGYLPDGEWLELMTTDITRYYSCLNVNADNDCRHIECL